MPNNINREETTNEFITRQFRSWKSWNAFRLDLESKPEEDEMRSPSSPLLNPVADFTSVPVVEVDRFNMDKHMEGMTKAVQQVTLYLRSMLILHRTGLCNETSFIAQNPFQI